jgi:phosphotriesterase-related protein
MIQTVTGRFDSIGKTLIHEHFVFGYAGFQGDSTLGELDFEKGLQVGMDVAERVQAHGVQTIVDPTPNDCGRNPLLLKEISERTGLQIVCTTGYYYEEEGAPGYFKFRASFGDAVEEIYEMFMKEITVGIGNTGIKAGAIKVASSKGIITDYEKMFFLAAARAQRETGVPILTHTQEGTMGPEQAELLLENGANPSQVLIGHMCGNTDISYHLKTLQTGVSIAFDRFGIQGLVGAPSDQMREGILLGLLGLGYADKLFLSHETVNYWLGRPLVFPEAVQQLLANYHVTNLFDNVMPILYEAGITQKQVDTMLISNPERLFMKGENVHGIYNSKTPGFAG